MGKTSTHNVVLLIVLIGGFIAVKMDTVFAQLGPPKPNGGSSCWDMATFVAHCYSSMQGFSKQFHMPSKPCCTYAQRANIVQFCNRFVGEKERIFDAVKVIDVARYCRHPLPSGTKCGNHTVP